MSDGMIHTGPLAGFTVTSDPNDPMIQVLGVHIEGRLGYLAYCDEWVVRVAVNGHVATAEADTLVDAADQAVQMVTELSALPPVQITHDRMRGWLGRWLNRTRRQT